MAAAMELVMVEVCAVSVMVAPLEEATAVPMAEETTVAEIVEAALEAVKKGD